MKPDRVASSSEKLACADRPIWRWEHGAWTRHRDQIAEEVPAAIVFNDRSYAVMLVTPRNLHDFVLGFALSEGVLKNASELLNCEIREHMDGVEIAMDIPTERAAKIAAKERLLSGRSGCGLCGTRALEEAVRWPPRVDNAGVTSSVHVQRAFAALAERQALNEVTGAVHGAAWASLAGEIACAREDIGRHNALDKLLGALARGKTDPASGMLLITSRASYEMVQKAAVFNIGLMAAISAPTALAVNMADSAGMTLVGFVRSDSHVAYTHTWRLSDAPRTLTSN